MLDGYLQKSDNNCTSDICVLNEQHRRTQLIIRWPIRKRQAGGYWSIDLLVWLKQNAQSKRIRTTSFRFHQSASLLRSGLCSQNVTQLGRRNVGPFSTQSCLVRISRILIKFIQLYSFVSKQIHLGTLWSVVSECHFVRVLWQIVISVKFRAISKQYP